MKTNQVMARAMGKYRVEQRTRDAYFNATSLLKQWNNTHSTKKVLAEYLSNKSTKEFIDTIIERESENIGNSPYLTTRGKNGGTWMHPMLFIDFAMWINPSFKYDVLKFVYDQMIAFRNEAGDAYRELSSAVAKITPKHQMQEVMSRVGKYLNIVVKGTHKKMLRNNYGDEESQKEYVETERKIAMLINEGFITNLMDLGNYFQKLSDNKNKPSMAIKNG